MKVKQCLLGFCLIFLSLACFAWMCGAFSIPPNLHDTYDKNMQVWAEGGFFAVPLITSILSSLSGVILVATCKKKH